MPKQKTKPEKQARAGAATLPQPRGGVRPWRWGLALAGAFLVLLAVYGPALGGPFVFDDLYLPFTFQEYANAPLLDWLRGVRPLLMLTFWVNHRLSGMEPYSYHFLNLLLHLLAGAATFAIVRRLLERAGEKGSRRDGLAAFAAAVFLLHPLQTESVAYVASRSEVLSVLLFYSALALFLYRKHESISWWESVAVLALFAAAVSTKEHTAVLPALLLLTDYFWNPGFSFQGIRRNWKLYVLVAGGGALAARLVWKVLSQATTAGFSVKDITWYQYFYTQGRAIWMYVRMFVLPYGQNLDPDFRPSLTLFDGGAAFGLAALAAVAIAALWYRKKYPLAAYGALTFLLLLAPTSSFVPIQDPVAERRVYLPFLGLLLVMLEFLRRSKADRGTLTAMLAGVLAVLSFLTYARSTVWSSSVALWEDSVAKAPAKQRPRFQLAFAYFEQGRCREALPQFEAAARNGKPDYLLLADWAMALDCAGNRPAALARLHEAQQYSTSAQLFTLYAMVYIHDSKWPEALNALSTAERLDPNFDTTYAYRGAVYASQGNLNAAAAEYRRALALNPQSEQAQQGLAAVERRLATGR
ncbi:MAG TPA: tetratricopeptide repeat protein [Bryobacteraceae bacterium]|nr:tetratricopeptide repeat protein [Bryobacteraceae bacterium]